MSETELLTRKEAAAILRVSPGTLANWTSAQKLAYVKIGGKVLFRLSDVVRLIADSTVPAKAKLLRPRVKAAAGVN